MLKYEFLLFTNLKVVIKDKSLKISFKINNEWLIKRISEFVFTNVAIS